MGCAGSYNEKAIAVKIPNNKVSAAPTLDPTSAGLGTLKNFSEIRAPASDEKNPNSIQESCLSQKSTPRLQPQESPLEEEKPDKVEGEMTPPLLSAIRPNFGSASSIDPKEGFSFLQSSRTRLLENISARDKVDSRSSFSHSSKPSIFLSPSLFSDNKVSLHRNGEPRQDMFHLSIPKSTDDFSLSTIRFETNRGMNYLGKLIINISLSNHPSTIGGASPRGLLVVPEQTDYTETIRDTTPKIDRRDTAENNDNLEEEEEDSSTRDKWGDTTSEIIKRVDNTDANPGPSEENKHHRQNKSIIGKSYRIEVTDLSYEKPQRRHHDIPKIKLTFEADNSFESSNLLKPHQPSFGTPKADFHDFPPLQESPFDTNPKILTLNVPTTLPIPRFSRAMENNLIPPNLQSGDSRDSARKLRAKSSEDKPVAEPKVSVPMLNLTKEDELQIHIKTKFRVNLLEMFFPKTKPSTTNLHDDTCDIVTPVNYNDKKASWALYSKDGRPSTDETRRKQEASSLESQKGKTLKPLEFSKLDFLSGLNGPEILSPIYKQVPQAGHSTPGGSKLDTSYLKPSGTSDNPPVSIEDRNSFQADSSYLDLDRSNFGDDISPMNLHPHRPSKISTFGARRIMFNKSKSVNFDTEIVEEQSGQFIESPGFKKGGSGHNRLLGADNPTQALLSPFYVQDSTPKGQGKDVPSFPVLASDVKRKMFARNRPKSQVIETDLVDKSVDEGTGYKKINQYIVKKELGRGSFGKVKLAMDTKIHRDFAIKIVNKAKLKKKVFAKDKTAYTQIQTEIAIMMKMKHPNIVELHEVIDSPDEDKLYLVMELIESGAVMSQDYFRKNPDLVVEKEVEMPFGATTVKCLSESVARKYFRDLVLGIDYMHNYANVIHRDIKPENLLIGNNNVLKISDFNIAHMVEETNDVIKNKGGTKLFLAPETWTNNSFRGKPLDIWAAGATLYYFLYGYAPFSTINPMELRRKILEEEPVFPENGGVSEGAINLIKACLTKSVDQRITIEKIFVDPWLTKNGEEPLNNDMFEVIEVSPEDVKKALRVKLKTAMMVANGLARSLNSARKTLNSMHLDSVILDRTMDSGNTQEKTQDKVGMIF